jgi:cold shock CspA family protein
MDYQTGTIIFWRDDKKYGFIKRDAGGGDGDVFCHINNCIEEPQQGDRVKYVEKPGRNGKPEAIGVEII